MSATPLPPSFIWTKMQAEAGQSLEQIVKRKEVERIAGEGVFFWGVGNGLGQKLTRLLARDSSPQVLFSIMRSRPKIQDVSPQGLLVWTAYMSAGGLPTTLPDYVLVLSRAETASGEKRRHYALICSSEEPLALHTLGGLNARHFRNLESSAAGVGASQVTAIVEHREMSASSLSSEGVPVQQYEVNMRATLIPPHFVKLARPLKAPPGTTAALDSFVSASPAPTQWKAFVQWLKASSQAAEEKNQSDFPELFDPLFS